jgi:cytochrome c oxidase subunit 3
MRSRGSILTKFADLWDFYLLFETMQTTVDTTPPAIETSHAHGGHPDHRLFGMLVFLFAEAMIFLGLFAAYLTFRSVAEVWPPAGTPELELTLPGINTLILISSSFVMNRGNQAIKQNDVNGLRLWFTLTAILGALFLVGQGYEYYHNPFGLTDNLFTSTFYVLTGFHGLHVCFGLSLICVVLLRSRQPGRYSSASHFGVEATELYWHFVDIVWIVLFLILYLL